MFTLRQRPAGITLCSHWLKPTVATPWFAYFPVLQDFEKKERESERKGQIKKESKKKKKKRERSLSLLLYVDFLRRCFVCVRAKRKKGLMWKQEHQQSDNKHKSFLRRSRGRRRPIAATVWQRLMTQCAPVDVQRASAGSELVKTHEFHVRKSAFSNQQMKTIFNLLLIYFNAGESFSPRTFCHLLPVCTKVGLKRVGMLFPTLPSNKTQDL